jgi:hypothetical protein
MQTPYSRNPPREPGHRPRRRSVFQPSLSYFVFLSVLAGCASPGQPIERKPPSPVAVTDLSAAQSGDDVVLTFTLPSETTDRLPIGHTPAIEIYRAFETTANALEPAVAATPALLLTIPSAMVDRYVQQGHVRYSAALASADFTEHPGALAVYSVRTRLNEKKVSAASNSASLRIYPAPDPIEDLKAEVTHSAIVLAWTPPRKLLDGTAASISGYRLYRETGAAAPAASAPPTTAPPAPSEKARPSPALIAEPAADSSSFSDPNFEFGQTYIYTLRSVVQTPSGPLESDDSNSVVLTPKDTFPPAAPLGVIVAFVPAQGDTPAHLELSWAISPETDVAGYNIYRSERDGVPGTRANNELLPTPAFRDMNTQPGRRYFYTVTAVDRSGNESPPSVAVSGGLPAEGQATP